MDPRLKTSGMTGGGVTSGMFPLKDAGKSKRRVMAKDYKIEAVINAKDNASPKFEKFSKGVSKWLKRAELAAIAAAIAFGTMSM